jgi:hypothetical protein
MKAALAVLALGLALALAPVPASAGSVYVPVLSPSTADGSLHSTEVWVSNPAGAQRAFSTFFIAAGTDGSQRSGSPPEIPIPARRTFLLSNVGSAGGLLEIRSGQEVSVEARVINTSPTGLQTAASVPVISAVNTIAAGKVGHLVGLERDATRGILSHLGVVNLGTQSAQCEFKLFRVDGTQIGPTVTLSFLPLSLRQFDDALGTLGEQRIADARAQVSCNQPFFLYSVQVNQPLAQVWFLSPSGSTVADSGGGPPTPGSGNSVVFQKSGLLHTAAAPSNPKGTINVPIQSELAVKRLVIDMDWVPGPWNREKIPGNHGIVWLYRGKFRSNTIANVNAFGPNKYTIKMNQNVDLGAGQVTTNEVGLQLEQGKRYHLHYVYDAATNQITAEVSHNGTLLKTLRMNGTAQGNVLTVKPPGLIVEFGHYPGQEGPEIPSWGWSYYDLKIEMFQ